MKQLVKNLLIALCFVYLAIAPIYYWKRGNFLFSWGMYANARPLCSFSFYTHGSENLVSVPSNYVAPSILFKDRRKMLLIRDPLEFKELLSYICQKQKNWLKDKDADLNCFIDSNWQALYKKKSFSCESIDDSAQNI
jgi:hypothetical protein